MNISLFKSCVFTVACVLLCSFDAFAQETALDTLKQSDESLNRGNFIFRRSLYDRDLAAPPDNVPPGTTITLKDEPIVSDVELRYSGDKFLRKIKSVSQTIIQESYDGTYFCSLTVPPPTNKETYAHLVVERKGDMYKEVIYPNGRMTTLYPGAMLLQGRGLTFLDPKLNVENNVARLDLSGVNAVATLDPEHGFLVSSFRLLNNQGRVIMEILTRKPVRLASGTWVASDATRKVFDKNGSVTTEERLTLLEDRALDKSQSFAPEVKQGYLVSFMVDGKEVDFEKVSDKPLTLAQLEALAEKKAPQDARLMQAIEKKSFADAKAARRQQTLRAGYAAAALVIACLIVALVRLLIKTQPSRSEGKP